MEVTDIASALAESSATGKPLLIYWTARWCPPCQEMWVTVLRTPEFARASRNCIVAEISGDAPGAQVWGERLGLSTYPTLLLLGPGGPEEELIRLPGGLPADLFCSVLRTALRSSRPVAKLAGSV